MSRRKQAKPRSVKAVDEGESAELAGSWESSSVQTDVPGPDREAEQKDQRAGLEDGEHSVTSHDDRVCEDDLDDDSIFTCDNCQQDFECLAELTEHRTHHCPAVHRGLTAVRAAGGQAGTEGGTAGVNRAHGGEGEGLHPVAWRCSQSVLAGSTGSPGPSLLSCEHGGEGVESEE
ncbi:hypothetical protein MATL_G00145860 [Megalops atlanticus]|uniref:C2H2-type domain-containing protein n=1 Tax=Megalops atlanticus TaxID=7932 RepID=A0A9D3PYW9_MEGAT|nr:hypothetical protein MATL_G00145860 [Megalops atlanticus]